MWNISSDAYSLTFDCIQLLRDRGNTPFGWHSQKYLILLLNIIYRDLYNLELRSPVPNTFGIQSVTPSSPDSDDVHTEELAKNFGRFIAHYPNDYVDARFMDDRTHFRTFWEGRIHGKLTLANNNLYLRGKATNDAIKIWYRYAFMPLAFGTITSGTTTSVVVNATSAGKLIQVDDFYNGGRLAVVQVDTAEESEPTTTEIRTISDYVASTKTFTLSSALNTAPTSSMKWALVPGIRGDYHDMIALGATGMIVDSNYALPIQTQYDRRYAQYMFDLGIDFPHAVPTVNP